MAWAFVSAQSSPNATTATDLYTVPSSTKAIVHINVCNRSAVATSFRISKAVAGAVAANEQYYSYDTTISGNSEFRIEGITLNTTDKIRVYATLATLSFNLDGVEIS